VSIFAVEQVMWDVSRDGRMAEACRTDPGDFLAGYRLDAQEAQAIASLDIAGLSAWGINPMLLMQAWNALVGPDAIDEYLARMNGAGQARKADHG